jgi:hypothetical protein
MKLTMERRCNVLYVPGVHISPADAFPNICWHLEEHQSLNVMNVSWPSMLLLKKLSLGIQCYDCVCSEHAA